jgi:hypothetical protein
LGPDSFRDLLLSPQNAKLQETFATLSEELKECQINLYDIGDLFKYQLSKYQKKVQQESFSKIYQYIFANIPNSKIFVVGGSDDISKSVYNSSLFEHIVHIDSQIDVKPKFKLQIEDRD